MRGLARSKGLEVRQVNAGERKEKLVEQILAKHGRRPGVICVLGAIERCRCFKVVKNSESGFLCLQWSPGKCQHPTVRGQNLIVAGMQVTERVIIPALAS